MLNLVKLSKYPHFPLFMTTKHSNLLSLSSFNLIIPVFLDSVYKMNPHVDFTLCYYVSKLRIISVAFIHV